MSILSSYKGLYKRIEKELMPTQWLVIVGLLVIIGISGYLIVKGDNVKRTAWLVYLFMP